jgi:hypothetical protein
VENHATNFGGYLLAFGNNALHLFRVQEYCISPDARMPHISNEKKKRGENSFDKILKCRLV